MTARENPQRNSDLKTSEGDALSAEQVRTTLKSLLKFINAKRIYANNSPTVRMFAKACDDCFRTLFEHEGNLCLTVSQYQMAWCDQVVYDNSNRRESIAFLLYKDGVGEITFHSDVTFSELEQFVDLIKGELHNPSLDSDIVTRLWQADFTNISYRVMDEYIDGKIDGDRTADDDQPEQLLDVKDHCNLQAMADRPDKGGKYEDPTESISALFYRILRCPSSDTDEHDDEKEVQSMLASLFTVKSEALKSLCDETAAEKQTDKIVQFIRLMLDFSRSSDNRVILDIREGTKCLVRYLKEEADVTPLIELIQILGELVNHHVVAEDGESLLVDIEKSLAENSFLGALGETAASSDKDLGEVLEYYRLVGRKAVPALCEFLKHLDGPPPHRQVCEALISITGHDLAVVVNKLEVDDPQVAQNIVYLLLRSKQEGVPSVVNELVSHVDVGVRGQVVDLLTHIGSDEAASLLCGLLDDEDKSVRLKALAAAREFEQPVMADKVMSLCFHENSSTKSVDELEPMFRTVGKLAGEKIIGPVKQMIGRRGWWRFGRKGSRRNKLLVITALRFVPTAESLGILRELAGDRDRLVSARARYVLRTLAASEIEDKE